MTLPPNALKHEPTRRRLSIGRFLQGTSVVPAHNSIPFGACRKLQAFAGLQLAQSRLDAGGRGQHHAALEAALPALLPGDAQRFAQQADGIGPARIVGQAVPQVEEYATDHRDHYALRGGDLKEALSKGLRDGLRRALFLAVMAGGQLFGFTGVLLALPLAAVLLVFFRHANEQYKRSDLYNDH